MTAPLLEVRSLCAGFVRNRPVVSDLSFDLAAGDLASFLGPNGSGKSTAVLGLLAAVPFFGGAVRLGGRLLGPRPEERTGAGRLAAVLQRAPVFAELTGREHLSLAAGLGRIGPDEVDEVMADPLFGPLDRPGVLDRRTVNYSGGEQRLLGIASAVLRRPRVLLLDEPAAGLAEDLVGSLKALIEGCRARGVAVVLMEHRGALEIESTTRIQFPVRGPPV